MNKSVRRILGLTAIAALLSACGGGGGDTPAPVTDSPLAGGWAGTSTSGNTLLTLILENGKIWAIGGTLSNGSLLVSGVVFGTLQTSGNTVSSSDVRSYSLSTGTSIAGTLAGTFTAGSSINATATPQTGSATTISLAPAPTANYNYNTAATLAAVAGTWPGSFSQTTGTVVVNTNGTFSATDSADCGMSGSLQPRASG